jgi:hypothetical protein
MRESGCTLLFLPRNLAFLLLLLLLGPEQVVKVKGDVLGDSRKSARERRKGELRRGTRGVRRSPLEREGRRKIDLK